MTMIERVARALQAAPGWHDLTTGESFLLARAAIAAQRGGNGLHPWADHLDTFLVKFEAHQHHHGARESVMAGLNAMTDAALAEESTT